MRLQAAHERHETHEHAQGHQANAYNQHGAHHNNAGYGQHGQHYGAHQVHHSNSNSNSKSEVTIIAFAMQVYRLFCCELLHNSRYLSKVAKITRLVVIPVMILHQKEIFMLISLGAFQSLIGFTSKEMFEPESKQNHHILLIWSAVVTALSFMPVKLLWHPCRLGYSVSTEKLQTVFSFV